MRRGDIYLVHLDPTQGSEQRGARPAVVVSRDAINQYSPVVVICPITDAGHIKKLYPNDVPISPLATGLKKDSVVLTGQVRAVAKSRCIKFLGEIPPAIMQQVDRGLKITLNL